MSSRRTVFSRGGDKISGDGDVVLIAHSDCSSNFFISDTGKGNGQTTCARKGVGNGERKGVGIEKSGVLSCLWIRPPRHARPLPGMWNRAVKADKFSLRNNSITASSDVIRADDLIHIPVRGAKMLPGFAVFSLWGGIEKLYAGLDHYSMCGCE
jgi:hypothetical protein